MSRRNQPRSGGGTQLQTAPPQADPRPAALAAHAVARATARSKRLLLLQKIEADRNSKVITYAMANRGNISVQIGWDDILPLRAHLAALGMVDRLDLLIVSRGGNTLVPTRFVSLIREYTKHLGVLVPYMAHSAATMIALGADEIVMGAMGELGPVDPSVSNTFNPVQPEEDAVGGKHVAGKRPRIPISVEDVTAFLNLASERAKLDPGGMASAFSALTSVVHPLALGNIMRNHTLIRHLVKQLLVMHMDKATDENLIGTIVETLTEKLYHHSNLITRSEAKALGLKITKPSDTLEEALWKTFETLHEALKFDQQVDFGGLLGSDRQKYLTIDAAVLESANLAHAFNFRGLAERKAPNDYNFAAEFASWETC
jgi:hypothetical protein